MKKLILILFVLSFPIICHAQAVQPLVCAVVDMNTTADQPLNFSGYSNVIVRRVTVTSATISLTTATGGIYTAASKGGVQLVPSTQVYSALTTSTKFVDLTLQNAALNTVLNGQTVFFSLTTPQGSAATARVCVYGDQIN